MQATSAYTADFKEYDIIFSILVLCQNALVLNNW